MTDRFGMVKLQDSGSRYMGDEGSMSVSQQTMKEVEDIVVEIIAHCHNKATTLLRQHQDATHELANYLLKHETITGEEFMEILTPYLDKAVEE
jgi:cell division protease FtsH